MIWDAIVGGLLKTVAPKVAEFYTKKMELKHQLKAKKLEGKIALEQRKIDLADKAEARDAEWELAQIRNSGWKDEFTLLVLSIPLIGVFIPGVEPYIAAGFNNLESTPHWYRWLIIMIYAATWGIRVWRRESGHASV